VQLLKKFPAFYGTRWFTTVFTRALHWFLSWARSIQSNPSHPNPSHPISLRSILILSTHLYLGLPSGLLPSGFPTNILPHYAIPKNRISIHNKYVGFEALTAVVTMSSVFWDIMPCSPVKDSYTSEVDVISVFRVKESATILSNTRRLSMDILPVIQNLKVSMNSGSACYYSLQKLLSSWLLSKTKNYYLTSRSV
jgi:hypothetical protein